MSQGKGVTVFTSNPKSLRIPQDIKQQTLPLPTVLGIVQIIVGLLNILTGILFTRWGIHDHVMMWGAPFWLGGEFLISGIMTILVGNYPSYFLFTLTVILNEVSALLAVSAVGLYSWDLENIRSSEAYDYSSVLTPKHSRAADPLLYFEDWNVAVRRILDIMMIVFAILQLCMNVTFVVPSVRACQEEFSG